MNRDQSLPARAREFCRVAHAGQKRQGGAPYATHPEATADILRHYGVVDDVTLAAAYLHDVLEDTHVTEAELESAFGEDVTAVVRQVTIEGSHTRAAKQAALLEKARKMCPGPGSSSSPIGCTTCATCPAGPRGASGAMPKKP
jgi:(p)ppGpp synthase/HD superfamily hydrolase